VPNYTNRFDDEDEWLLFVFILVYHVNKDLVALSAQHPVFTSLSRAGEGLCQREPGPK
jgi:hypothetical protein